MTEVRQIMDDLNRAGEHGVSEDDRLDAQHKAISEFEKLGFNCCEMPALMSVTLFTLNHAWLSHTV